MPLDNIQRAEYATFLHECGYIQITFLTSGRVAVLHKLMFTTAILVMKEGDKIGYADRWCYSSEEGARVALENWVEETDGEEGTEPEGWHRHPSTGRRRVMEDGIVTEEYINH